MIGALALSAVMAAMLAALQVAPPSVLLRLSLEHARMFTY